MSFYLIKSLFSDSVIRKCNYISYKKFCSRKCKKYSNDRKFGRYVSTEGPWGMTATWVSEDSASYLVCKKENDEPFANVTAYFQGVDGWQAYELNSIDRIVYLDIVKDGVVVDGTSGYMKFDGTTFTITDLDKDTFGADEFHYVITDKEFSPD